MSSPTSRSFSSERVRGVGIKVSNSRHFYTSGWNEPPRLGKIFKNFAKSGQFWLLFLTEKWRKTHSAECGTSLHRGMCYVGSVLLSRNKSTKSSPLKVGYSWDFRDFAHCGERPYFGPPQNMEKTLHSCVGIFEIPTRAVVALFGVLRSISGNFLWYFL